MKRVTRRNPMLTARDVTTSSEVRAVALRLEGLKRAASVWSDLVNDNHIHAGGIVTPADRPVSVSKPSAVTPGGTNLLAGILPFTGYTLGTLGSGGVLPTGLIRNNNGAVKVLHAVDGDSIDLTFNTQSGSQSCGGFIIDAAPPAAGDYLLSFTVDCPSSTTDWMQILVRSYNTVTPGYGSWENFVYLSEEHAVRKTVCRMRFASTNERILIQVYGYSTGDIGKSARFVLSDFMLIAESDPLPPHGGLLSVPSYSRTSTAASDITIDIPTKYAGEHMVAVKTVERGWIVERGTLAAGDNDLSDLFPGASITVQEIVAIPASAWEQGDLDVIAAPVYASLEYHWLGDGTNNGYRRSLSDTATMLAQPIAPHLGAAGTELPYAVQMGIDRAALHRFEVHENDRNQGGTGPGPNDRAEIVHGTELPPNTDVWISFWCRMSAFTDPAKFANIMQIRYYEITDSNLPPELSFGPQYGGGIRATLRSDHGVTGTTVFSTDTPFAQYEVGKWHRCVLRINLSTSGEGNFGFWWDGEEIYDDDVPVGYNRYGNEPPVIHHGIYRQNSDVALVLDFQHYEVSTTSLAGRITAPLPI